nr:hypothetical protein [uncultured Albidiferax sp.]
MAAVAEHRSVPRKIEYWARIGKAVLENPDLPLRVIQDTMPSTEEAKAGQVSAFTFGYRSIHPLPAGNRTRRA